MRAESLQSCPTLHDPMDWGPPGSSVHGILQARILERDCHVLLQGIFPTQGLNSSLLSPALAGGFFITRAIFIYLKKPTKNRDREAFKEITFYSLLCDIYLSRMGISCWHITNTFLNLLENWLL